MCSESVMTLVSVDNCLNVFMVSPSMMDAIVVTSSSLLTFYANPQPLCAIVLSTPSFSILVYSNLKCFMKSSHVMLATAVYCSINVILGSLLSVNNIAINNICTSSISLMSSLIILFWSKGSSSLYI